MWTMDEQKILLHAAFMKWVNGEALSYSDAERLFMFITGQPLTISSPQPEEIARLRSEANKRWQALYMQQ
jgi:hypothetical protein